MDQQVKERVVGAAVLVLAAVIFIPMILAGSPQERSADGNSRSPAQDLAKASAQTSAAGSVSAPVDSGFSSRIVPLGSAPRSSAIKDARQAVSEAQTGDPIVAPAKKPVQLPPLAAPPPAGVATQMAATKKPAVRKSIEAPEAQILKDGWVVQMGSFANARNAHALRDRLKSKGYKAFARSAGTGAAAVTRVYVGPDATRERAQQRVSRLLSETRLQGIVIRYPK